MSAASCRARRFPSGVSKGFVWFGKGMQWLAVSSAVPVCKSASPTPPQEAELLTAALRYSALLVCEGTYENIFGVRFPGRSQLVKIEGKH